MKIKHPGVALLIVFLMAAGLNLYGVTKGSLLIFDIIGGVFFYRLLTVPKL